MFAALVASIHKTELPGDYVGIRRISRLLPTPATWTPAADEK